MIFIAAPLEPFKRLRFDWPLLTAAVAHLLLALSFVIVLALATTRAQAQDIVCSGSNLVDTLAEEQPDALAQIMAEAEAVPNGESLLWRVEKGSSEPSWLYGTMHVSDPRVVEMTDAARDAYDRADTIVVEVKEVADLESAMAALMTDPSLTMLPDGKTISDLLSAENLAELEAVLDERGLPLSFFTRMKPWLIFSMISIPDCEMQRRASGLEFLDMKLAGEALQRGKRLEGLETIEEQVSILSNLPLDVQVTLLADTAALGPVLDDVYVTMTELYLDQNIALYMPLIMSAAVNPDVADDKTGIYARFERDLIDTRNHTMAERVQPMLESGNAFIAVGALHLPGEEGLVALLRDAGYTVTPVR
ncbi:MAG: TraB/GumN family protein [Pseudomonadota bacterium]